MITWGLTGRGDNRVATVFCMDCRVELARDVPPGQARTVSNKAAITHNCNPRKQP